MSAITVNAVSKRFAETSVLHGVDLEVPQGAIVGLLGPSGCGKTTLLRMIAGFEKPDDGYIAFDGNTVVSQTVWAAPEKRGIGYVPQEGTLFPHLTVSGNIRYGLSRSAGRQERDQRVQQVLDLAGLSGLGDRYPQEISGGQQQRVALARALAPGPKLMLLDEPFNALDLDLRRSMCEEVVHVLRKTNTTTILVTHDPGEAFAVSDKLAVMQAGVIMQCSSPPEIYWQPVNAAVAGLTGQTLFVDGECEAGMAVTVLGILPLHATCPPVNGPARIMIRPEQIRLTSEIDASMSPAPGAKGVTAHITRRSFRGDHTILDLFVANVPIRLRLPSLFAPDSDIKTGLYVQGTCMAYADL